MKYCVLIADGAAGLPLKEKGGKTSLELAHTPNLDAMARSGTLGLTRTVPEGMEPSSACACMSLLGYDPSRFPLGRAAIEAASIGIDIGEEEAVFRCNLASVINGRMLDYSAGHIGGDEASRLISSLQTELGGDDIRFFTGVGYRHICKLGGHMDTLDAICTPPHNIPGRRIKDYLPTGRGSKLLRDLMMRSKPVLSKHEVNIARSLQGRPPANMIWLFWGSRMIQGVPSFKEIYGLDAAVTSGVDVIRGMAGLMGMQILDIKGITDGLDNDFYAQGANALLALNRYDLVVIHIEAPDEAGHAGCIEDKVTAIERIDSEVASQLRSWSKEPLRLLLMPDHPTPLPIRTHTAAPVPFMLWGQGVDSNGALRFTEAQAEATGLHIDPAHRLMAMLIAKSDT